MVSGFGDLPAARLETTLAPVVGTVVHDV